MPAKPKLYIIHGWTYTTTPWARTISLLEKRGLKVEMLNVPGLTTSSKKVWTIDDYVKWADRNLPEGATVLGHSNGGRILLNLCVQKPHKLGHLILLDAAGVYETSGRRDFARALSKKLSFLKNIPGLTKIWHKLTGATDYARAPENMKRTLTNMLDSDKDLDMSKVTVPTTILWGEADTVTPPRQGEIMHDRIKGSTFYLHDDWTHAPYLSHPDELAEAIYQAVKNPPEKTEPSNISDTAAVSAALALKRAPEPVLESKGPKNPVAPNVPTKLVLRKNDSKLTEGMVISDAEDAALKYEPKKTNKLTKTTDASKNSASANFKKAATSVKPDTDVTSGSASATIKKANKKVIAKDSAAHSASLSLKRNTNESTGIIADLDQKSAEKVDFIPKEPAELAETKKSSSKNPEPTTEALLAKAITSGSVPKAPKRRLVTKKTKPSSKGKRR